MQRAVLRITSRSVGSIGGERQGPSQSMATVGFRLAVPPPVGRGGEAAKCVSPSSRFPRSPSLALPRRFPPRTRTHRRPSAPAPGSSISEKRPSSAAEAEAEEEVVDPCAEVRYLDPEADGGSIREWELDFCSRPILDERGKKVWELVVCDRTLSLQYTRYFPNNVINSVTLKDAIASVATTLGVPLPDKIRFFRSRRLLSFSLSLSLPSPCQSSSNCLENYKLMLHLVFAIRSQMVTIITKACNELGIKPIPSKRVSHSPEISPCLESLVHQGCNCSDAQLILPHNSPAVVSCFYIGLGSKSQFSQTNLMRTLELILIRLFIKLMHGLHLGM